MVERISALEGLTLPQSFGPDLVLDEHRPAAIWQLTAWPDRLNEAAKAVAAAAGVESAPPPLRSASGAGGWLLRTEPLRWLLVSDQATPAPDLAGAGTVLDLGHARTVIRITGRLMPDLMARNLSLDLRPSALTDGSVATSGLHHVAVTLHAREGGIDLYTPRSFGKAIFEHLAETAAQFAVA